MTQQMISAIFDSRPEALRAVDELVKAGIPRTSVRLLPENEVPAATATGSYDQKRDDKGFWASLADFFLPDDDRYTYAEAMNRGSIMVSVTVDPAHSDQRTIRASHTHRVTCQGTGRAPTRDYC